MSEPVAEPIDQSEAAQHYREAERLLAAAKTDAGTERSQLAKLKRAAVHAQLAHVAHVAAAYAFPRL